MYDAKEAAAATQPALPPIELHALDLIVYSGVLVFWIILLCLPYNFVKCCVTP